MKYRHVITRSNDKLASLKVRFCGICNNIKRGSGSRKVTFSPMGQTGKRPFSAFSFSLLFCSSRARISRGKYLAAIISSYSTKETEDIPGPPPLVGLMLALTPSPFQAAGPQPAENLLRKAVKGDGSPLQPATPPCWLGPFPGMTEEVFKHSSSLQQKSGVGNSK